MDSAAEGPYFSCHGALQEAMLAPVSPGSGLETGRNSTVSKEVIPRCHRNWGFLVPPLSLAVIKMRYLK